MHYGSRMESLSIENKFKETIECLKNNAIFILDKNGCVMEWNAGIEKIYGYTESEVIGRHHSFFCAQELKKCHNSETVLELALKYELHENECTMVDKYGRFFLAKNTIKPLYDKQKKHCGYIKVISDVSDKKRLEAATQEAQKMNAQKTFFLACMSHEIRSPLNTIIGAVDLLKEKELELSKESQYLVNIAQASCETLLSILNNILDFSRIELDEIKLEKMPFSLPEEVRICVLMAELHAMKKNIDLKIDIDSQLDGYMEGDAIRLRQILLNLLSNAIKFSQMGTISISVHKISESIASDKVHLLFSVSDQGMGIPEDQQARIFETFKQAHDSINRKFGGTGLGLFITKKLVELMGGKIWVNSVVGQGSTFHFTIQLDRTTPISITKR